MLLIAGLGNPGSKYDKTRHNIGFEIIDSFVKRHKLSKSKTEHNSLTYKVSFEKVSVLLAKPQSFMNLSGKPILSLVKYYKINLNDLLVIHDDVDQKFGAIKLQSNRGSGGHNGIKDISDKLASQNYNRLKIGVGKEGSTHDHVLSKFQATELDCMDELLDYACKFIEEFVKHGFKSAVQYNRKGFR